MSGDVSKPGGRAFVVSSLTTMALAFRQGNKLGSSVLGVGNAEESTDDLYAIPCL